jgi:lysozyme family protein
MFEKKKKNNQNIIVHPLWIMVEQIKKNIEKHKFKKNKFEQVKKNTNGSCLYFLRCIYNSKPLVNN